jgi:hypothetical protein
VRDRTRRANARVQKRRWEGRGTFCARRAGSAQSRSRQHRQPERDPVRNLTIGGTAVFLAPAPTSKDECKGGGWVAGGYKNQGQCVSSFARA